MSQSESPQDLAEAALALNAAILKALVAKKILSREDLSDLLNGVIVETRESPNGSAIKAAILALVPRLK